MRILLLLACCVSLNFFGMQVDAPTEAQGASKAKKKPKTAQQIIDSLKDFPVDKQIEECLEALTRKTKERDRSQLMQFAVDKTVSLAAISFRLGDPARAFAAFGRLFVPFVDGETENFGRGVLAAQLSRSSLQFRFVAFEQIYKLVDQELEPDFKKHILLIAQALVGPGADQEKELNDSGRAWLNLYRGLAKWERYSLEDSVKKPEDLAQAEKLLKDFDLRKKEHKNPFTQNYACRALADISSENGNDNEGLEWATLAARVEDPKGKIKASRLRFIFLGRLGRYNDAHKAANSLFELLRQNPELERMYAPHLRLSAARMCLVQATDHTPGSKAFKESMKAADDHSAVLFSNPVWMSMFPSRFKAQLFEVRGDIFKKQGAYEEAASYYSRIPLLEGISLQERYEAVLNEAECNTELGKRIEAIEALKPICEQNECMPLKVLANSRTGLAYMALDEPDYQRAIESLECASELAMEIDESFRPGMFFFLGMAYSEEKRYEDSQRLLDKAEQADSGGTLVEESCILRARNYYALGEFEKGLALIENLAKSKNLKSENVLKAQATATLLQIALGTDISYFQLSSADKYAACIRGELLAALRYSQARAVAATNPESSARYLEEAYEAGSDEDGRVIRNAIDTLRFKEKRKATVEECVKGLADWQAKNMDELRLEQAVKKARKALIEEKDSSAAIQLLDEYADREAASVALVEAHALLTAARLTNDEMSGTCFIGDLARYEELLPDDLKPTFLYAQARAAESAGDYSAAEMLYVKAFDEDAEHAGMLLAPLQQKLTDVVFKKSSIERKLEILERVVDCDANPKAQLDARALYLFCQGRKAGTQDFTETAQLIKKDKRWLGYLQSIDVGRTVNPKIWADVQPWLIEQEPVPTNVWKRGPVIQERLKRYGKLASQTANLQRADFARIQIALIALEEASRAKLLQDRLTHVCAGWNTLHFVAHHGSDPEQKMDALELLRESQMQNPAYLKMVTRKD